MIKRIVMPAAGQTTDAATVTEISVAVGDKVKRGDVLLKVETDKATLPIESVASGFVCTIDVAEFDRIDAGTLLMTIGGEDDLAAAMNGKAADNSSAADASPAEKDAGANVPSDAEDEDDFVPVSRKKGAASSTADKSETAVKCANSAVNTMKTGVKAMPAAKKAAAELGIALDKILPANGEFIKKSDVEAYAKAAAPAPASVIDDRIIPTSVMRDSLASKLDRFSAPTQSVTVSVNAESMASVIEKSSDAENTVTPGDFVMLALARLSQRFPLICARNEKGKIRKCGCSFGLAYTGINGTVSATCPDCDSRRLSEIARINGTNPQLLEKGDMTPCGANSLTVFDLSSYGIDTFVPTVSSPEIMSVGIGGMKIRPAVCADGGIKAVRTINVTLAYDCRIVDPTVASALATKLCAMLEEPGLML